MFTAIKNNKRNYIAVEIVSIICMVIFYLSQLGGNGGLSKRRILEYAIILFCIVVVPVLCVAIKGINSNIDRVFSGLQDAKEYIFANKTRVIINLVVFVVIIPVSALIGALVSKNPFVPYTIAALLYVLYFVLIFKNKSGVKPEGLFVCIALVIGLYSINVTPSLTGIQMDDEVHYSRSVQLANFFGGVTYEADSMVINRFAQVILDKRGIDKTSRDEMYSEINNSYSERNTTDGGIIGGGIKIWTISYVPGAIGIMVGRAFNLSYINCFAMGRFFNLLIYVLVFYLAIKKVKNGKIIFMALGLIPTSVFLASTYTYDAWVFAFMALGYAYFISILQSEEKMKNKDMILMVIFFTLGVMPKAIYVVLLFPLLFMPGNKFTSKKQRVAYYLLGVCIVLVLCSSFAFPVANGSYGGDTRGGETVNSTQQLMYILGHPVEYTKLLFSFLKGYLSFASSQPVLQFFGYVGRGEYYLLVLVTLAVTAFVDKGTSKNKVGFTRVASLIGAGLGAMMVATSLYLLFTPVGLNAINGCQPRYILPLLVPALYFIAPEGIGSNAKRNWLANSVALIMGVTFIINIYNLSVKLYM